ncbi:MAG: hypothetical protein ACR2PK_19015 [Acidimicrobiales bacterium]
MATTHAKTGWWDHIFQATASAGSSVGVLNDRNLRIVRVLVLAVFATTLVVYTADLFALWDETHRIKFKTGPDQYGTRTTHNFFGLTLQERELLTGSRTDVPGWYPAFVVARNVAVGVVAIGLAWLIYSRRPRHAMAYLTTLFILLGPWIGNLDEDDSRLNDSVVAVPAELLGILSIAVFLSFLWLFPDGRFLGALARLVASVVAFVAAIIAAGLILDWTVGSDADEVGEILAGVGFLAVLVAVLLWFAMGVALQVWRYKNTPIPDRRLARWNLAFLVAIPLWVMPFEALHELFSDSDVDRYNMSGFVWEQIHETLYLIAPAVFGLWILFLVRRQGWWDFQTLWNRTAVYGIGLAALAVVYGAALGLVSLAAAPLGDGSERLVAVMAATAAVAFAHGPLLAQVRHWVDDRWFPRRAEVDQLSLAFADDIRDADTPAIVPDRLRAVVQTQLDPEHVELWTPGGERR